METMKKTLWTIGKIILMTLGAGVALGAAIILSFLMGISLLLFLIGGCSNNPIPPDDELIRNFMAHEKEFNEIKELALKMEDGDYYPPFDRIMGDDNDKKCDKWLTQEERDRLDALLKAVGCKRIYYRSRAYYRGEPSDSNLTLTYWARGLSIGGTWKEYYYNPGMGEDRIYTGTETGDLMELTNWGDTIVYKPIKGKWYIEFGHDN